MDDGLDLEGVLPPRSAVRPRAQRAVGALADLALDLRHAALGIGRALDRAAAEGPRRTVAVLGVYDPGGATAMREAAARLRRSRHRVEFALGAMGEPAAGLEAETALSGVGGGRFANLNRLADAAHPLAADWVLLIDDDVGLGRGFLDRAIHLAERFGFDLAQPALRRASHTAWEVTRRRATLARQTRFVEIGPVLLMRRDVYRALAPFPEQGMGWGVDSHWAALAQRRGWRLGVIDAVAVRHDTRPTGSGYRHADAAEAAREFLARHEHLPYTEAEQVLARHVRLP